MTFSLGGYNTTYYSLEFPTLRGTIIDYQLKITMVKLPAGMTTVDPAAGGTVPVTGAVTAQLTVNPSTTVKDASGKDVAGEINITATPVNDIVTGQAESTTGLAVLQFLPEGDPVLAGPEFRRRFRTRSTNALFRQYVPAVLRCRNRYVEHDVATRDVRQRRV